MGLIQTDFLSGLMCVAYKAACCFLFVLSIVNSTNVVALGTEGLELIHTNVSVWVVAFAYATNAF